MAAFMFLLVFYRLLTTALGTDCWTPRGQKYIFNGRCLDKCPSETVIVNKTCQCPQNMPLIKDNGSESVCVSTCGKGYVIDGSKCIKVTDCTKPIIDNGKCLNACPPGYIYFTSIFENTDMSTEYGGNSRIYHHDTGEEERVTCKTLGKILAENSAYICFMLLYCLAFGLFMSTKEFTCIDTLKKKIVGELPSRQHVNQENDNQDNGSQPIEHTGGDGIIDDEQLLSDHSPMSDRDEERLINRVV